MTLYIVALLIAGTATSLVLLVAQLVPARSSQLAERLAELQRAGSDGFAAPGRRQRQRRREQAEGLIRALGERMERRGGEDGTLRKRLIQGGFVAPAAAAYFWGIRTAAGAGGAMLSLTIVPILGAPGNLALLAAVATGIAGWIVPSFALDSRVRARQKEIRLALPDALDLLVVCVEAGLGLNQAILRVSDEIRNISVRLSEEFGLVNAQIRAGTPREDALRALGDRSGVDDLRSLTAMLIQSDRFGTSLAQALRIQSDTLRTKRRQRAEEAAAKTAIKMLFPLVVFIFPSLFVVILGPAIIQIMAAMGGM